MPRSPIRTPRSFSRLRFPRKENRRLRVFEMESEYLLPELDPEEQVGKALRRLLTRETAA